ncbi:MAG: hypothetical protein K9L30_18895 [Desulfobacterales bacterium]|nr:hypothetical protein [Desulfobacterales bacterium]
MKKALVLFLSVLFMVVGVSGIAMSDDGGGIFAEENFSATVYMTTDYVSKGVSYSDKGQRM